MPEKLQMLSQDMHSEAWWIRVLDDELTPLERELWEGHLLVCERCRLELDALTRVDAFFELAPAVPTLSADFTATTVRMITNKQRWRRLLGFIAGTVVVCSAGLLVAGTATSLFASFGQGVGAVVSARGMLFRSFVHTALALLARWRVAIPYLLGTTALAYALVMPNGLLMTFALVWLSSRRRTRATVRI